MSGGLVRYFWVTIPSIKHGKKRKCDDGEGNDGLGDKESFNGGSSQIKRYFTRESEEGSEIEKGQSSQTAPSPSNLQ